MRAFARGFPAYPLRLLALLVGLALSCGQGQADTRVQFSTGFIAAVGVEVDEDGHPMLAEYDANGYFVSDVGYLGLGELEEAVLYRAADWRAFVLLHQQLQAGNPQATDGATLMSREQYESRQFSTRALNPVAIDKPDLLDNTQSVYVVSEERMLVPQPVKQDFILAEYPVALHQETTVAEEAVTLILNPDGEILRSSNYDISVKAAVYREEGRRSRDGFERLWQPIPNADVAAGIAELNQFPGGRAVSQEDGRYSMTYLIPPCPGFYYEINVPIIATLNIENFNPKADEQGFLTALRDDPKVCVGYGDVSLGSSLAALSAQLAAQAIVATLATPIYTVDVTFSTMQLNGLATMPEVRLGGTTEYSEDSDVNPLEDGEYRFDFNLDGIEDIARINADDNSQVDIWISPNQPEDEAGDPVPPDLTRVADFELPSQPDHQGMLSEISQSDLEDTDVYVFRRSTGQLIGAIEGLAERQQHNGVFYPGAANPDGSATYRGVHEDEEFATFGFTSFLVGAVSSDIISNYRNGPIGERQHRRPWLPSEGDAGGFASDRVPESLRPGEVVQVIAINRATGYIGSQDVTIQPSGTTLTPPTPIFMEPPNLKIVASRSFRDRNELSGVTEERVNIIGTEGAGLTSDTFVRIQSIWLAANGDVLPEGLPGFTGRVAISTGSSTDDYSGNFEIKPGYQTQLVQLNNASDLRLEHFYVQVVGEPSDGNPQFDSPGAGEGRLQTRPKKYVPILVPVHDEIATREADTALARARLDGVEDLPPRAEPVYHWVYRPEMQFSVYELKQNELQLRYEVVEGEEATVVDLRDIGQNEFNEILNQVSVFELLYDLSGPESEALETFGPGRDLVFSIGEQEVTAVLADEGVIRFDNLEHIDLLSSTDYLAISLFDNNDSANRLWEWAFLANIFFVDETGTRVNYEASFSHPNPVIQVGKGGDLDEITSSDVSFDAETGLASLQFSGKVFCDLADLIEDGGADISQIQVVIPPTRDIRGFQTLDVDLANISSSPIEEYLPFDPADPPEGLADETHPFIGKFSTTVNIDMSLGDATVLLVAENVIGNKGYAWVTVRSAFRNGRYIVTGVEQNLGEDRGLYRPLWMQVEDPLLFAGNLEDARVNVFGELRPVVENNGKYYADRAFTQVGRPLADGVEANNVLNVLTSPELAAIDYESPEPEQELPPVEQEFGWGYTAASPPGFYKYAAGTSVAMDYHSSWFDSGWEVDEENSTIWEKIGSDWTKSDIDTHSDVIAVETRPDDNGKKVRRFSVRLEKEALDHPEKRIEIALKKEDERRSFFSSHFNVVPLKTVILAIDGLPHHTARRVIDVPNSNFNAVFDGAINLDEPVLSALPTITWANWPGVFGGGSPSEHGILGNSYFPRESRDLNLRYPVFSAGVGAGRIDKNQQLGVAFGGRGLAENFDVGVSMADRVLENTGSLYDDVAAAIGEPINARSIRVFYDAHGANVTMDSNFFNTGDTIGHSYAAARELDNSEGSVFESIGSGPQAAAAWPQFRDSGDIMSVYLPGTDNAGHSIGHEPSASARLDEVVVPVNSTFTHASGPADAAVGRLLEQIRDDGYLNAVLWVAVSDHGLKQYSDDDDRILLTSEMEDFFAESTADGGLDMRLWRTGLFTSINESYALSDVAYSPNGGLAQFYLRGAANWQQAPSANDIKRVASLLYREAQGHDTGRMGWNDQDGGSNPDLYEFDYPVSQLYDDLAPVGVTTDGAFGSPPAIFVRYSGDCVGEDETVSNFLKNYCWVQAVNPPNRNTNADPANYMDIELGSIQDFLDARNREVVNFDWPEFEKRLEEMNHQNETGSRSGDIVAITDGRRGYLAININGDKFPGWHGGPTIAESDVPLIFNMPGENFVDEQGQPIDFPEGLTIGFDRGKSQTGVGAGRLRNWHLSSILTEIVREFRGAP